MNLDLFTITMLLHDLGLAWGVGGATVAGLLMFKSEKDASLGPFVAKVMPELSKLMWAAIILLGISGILLGRETDRDIDGTVQNVKMVVVTLLVLNALNMTFRIAPAMTRLAPTKSKPSPEFLKLKDRSKLFGSLGIGLWYLVLLLSVLM